MNKAVIPGWGRRIRMQNALKHFAVCVYTEQEWGV